MNSFLLVVYFSLLCCNMMVICSETNVRQPRILNENLQNSNRRYQNDDYATFEEQNIEQLKINNGSSVDTTIDDVIREIIDSSRQGRNVEGLDEVYSDPSVVQALTAGDDIQARNVIRDKLCDLGLMECEKPRPTYYANPPHQLRPQSQLPPFKQLKNPNGIYGPPQPVPLNYNRPNNLPTPPRKVGFAPSPSFNNYPPSQQSKPIHEKYSTEIFEHDSASSSVRFGYTEKPTIVVNQGKREVPAVSQNTHVHHHYVHNIGSSPNDGLKTVFTTTPISEYTPSDAFTSSLANKHRDQNNYEYDGYSSSSNNYGLSSNLKPVVEGYSGFENSNQNQYNSANQFEQSTNHFNQKAPQTFTDGLSNNNGLYKVGASYHAAQPDFHKKELNLNGNREQSAYYNNIQQTSHTNLNKYSNKYNNVGDEECLCVPAEQCPSEEIVRRDDLILPIDPRNLPVDIEAESDSSNVTTIVDAASSSNTTVHKISKRQVDNKKADGESRIGGYSGYGYGQKGKKIIPTLGVSFGLPVPSLGGYPVSPFPAHIPNPHFGAFNPNGLNLGLINVNPLVSFQVTKSEFDGQKLVKPFINLHVTPNKGILDTVGGLFHAKKSELHKHLHLHRYPPQPPPYIEYSPEFAHPPFHPHHHEGPPFHPHHHEGPPFLPPNIEGPPFLPPQGFIEGPNFPSHPPHFPFPPAPHEPFPHPHGPPGPLFDAPPHSYPPNIAFRNNNNISRSNDASFVQNNYANNQALYRNEPQVKDDYRFRYARKYQDIKSNENFVQSIPAQAPGNADGSDFVTFPNSRRKRDTDQVVPKQIDDINNKHASEEASEDSDISEQTGRALNGAGIKRQAFFTKQCSANSVCCRRPIRQSQPQQTQYYNNNIQQQQQQQQQQQNQYTGGNNALLSKANRCGVRNSQGINGRIKNPSYVDGDSEFAEYPWQVAILKKDPKESVYVCGGTLIDENHIMTAAHCVKTYSGFDLRVRLGEWDVNHDVEFYPYVERDIISVSVHPNYYAGTLVNDIAILRMNQPVDIAANPHINTACMPDRYTDYSRQRCWTTGWGKNNWEFGKYQNILKEVDVPIIDHNTCQSQMRQTRLGNQFVLNPGFICAGGEEGKDACRGDGGGPLVCERNGSWQVVGIVSWGIGCGKQNVPGVYVKVSHYLEWIQQITQRI